MFNFMPETLFKNKVDGFLGDYNGDPANDVGTLGMEAWGNANRVPETGHFNVFAMHTQANDDASNNPDLFVDLLQYRKAVYTAAEQLAAETSCNGGLKFDQCVYDRLHAGLNFGVNSVMNNPFCYASINDCSGHGLCLLGDCVCNQGWSGEQCDVEQCPVVLNDCSGQGFCEDKACVCNIGWGGAADCSKPFCFPNLPQDCSGHGTCEVQTTAQTPPKCV